MIRIFITRVLIVLAIIYLVVMLVFASVGLIQQIRSKKGVFSSKLIRNPKKLEEKNFGGEVRLALFCALLPAIGLGISRLILKCEARECLFYAFLSLLVAVALLAIGNAWMRRKNLI